jgi:hypothetical protein
VAKALFDVQNDDSGADIRPNHDNQNYNQNGIIGSHADHKQTFDSYS